MMPAVRNGAVLARAERTVVVEGDHCFPPESLSRGYVSESRTRSLCMWKGIARCHEVTVDGQEFANGVPVQDVPEAGR